MWWFSFILIPIVVSIVLPWVIYTSIIENGKLKKDKFICKCPIIYGIISIVGVLLFSFIFLMVYLTSEEKEFDFLYIILLITILIFTVFSYICFRYKIVLDIMNEEIIIYRLFAVKRHFELKSIYSLKLKDEASIIYGVNNKKLFCIFNLLSGYPILISCLRVVIENNISQEPLALERLKELLEREY